MCPPGKMYFRVHALVIAGPLMRPIEWIRAMHDLAVQYLDDRKLHVSKIAWLLGFREVSAFTHAFKRWTGKTPSQLRTAGAY
jgi:AraC-like DNA-binding protein